MATPRAIMVIGSTAVAARRDTRSGVVSKALWLSMMPTTATMTRLYGCHAVSSQLGPCPAHSSLTRESRISTSWIP
ncbi:hypothetical protein GCM10010160_74300 [Acrocarpospora corrugata]